MLIEGLRRSHGNITQAAECLGLTRQAVQQMVASLSLKHWIAELRATHAEARGERSGAA